MRALTIVFLTLLTVAAFAGGAYLGYDYVQLKARVASVEKVNSVLAQDYLNRKVPNFCPAPCAETP